MSAAAVLETPDLAVYRRYLELRESSGELKARCPWHDDNGLSLAVYDDGTHRCFSCEAHGDALDLIMKVADCELSEAKETLAELVGITHEMEGGPGEAREHADKTFTANRTDTPDPKSVAGKALSVKRLEPLVNPRPNLDRSPNALLAKNAVQGHNGFKTLSLYPMIPGRNWVPDTRRDRQAEVEAIVERDRQLNRARKGLSDDCPVGAELTVYGYEGRDHYYRFDPWQFLHMPRDAWGRPAKTGKRAASDS